MKSPQFSKTVRLELFSPLSFIGIILIGIIYIFIAALAINYRLLADVVANGFPLSAKLTILFALFQGIWSTMHPLDNILLIANALLVGINFVLLLKTLYFLEHGGKMKLSIGGLALLSLVTTGCASCGLSILSILGLSTVVSFLPFHGTEIHVLALFVLIFSGFYMLRQLDKSKYCTI